MKKFLLLLALCGVMVACGDDKKETSKDVVAICNKMVEAAKAGNEAEFRALWDAQLKMGDNADAKAAAQQWAKENPEGMKIIEQAADELGL